MHIPLHMPLLVPCLSFLIYINTFMHIETIIHTKIVSRDYSIVPDLNFNQILWLIVMHIR